MSLHLDALRVLSAWTAPTRDQVGLRTAYLDFLAAHDDGLWRSCRPSHLTASALVLDPAAGHVLLTLHPKVGRWLQLGGHCEPGDTTLGDAAAREASEESGLPGLSVGDTPLRLDRHRVRCGPDGSVFEHLDVQYLAVSSMTSPVVPSKESPTLRWWPVDALPRDADQSVRALVRAALARSPVSGDEGPSPS